jgi:hypothetical protein
MTQHYIHNVKPSLTHSWGFGVLRCITYVAVVALLACLFGCGTAPLKADPLPTVVKVPVVTPCLDKLLDKPALMTDAQLLDGSDYQVVVNLRLDRDQRRVYEAQLEAVEQACLKSVEK